MLFSIFGAMLILFLGDRLTISNSNSYSLLIFFVVLILIAYFLYLKRKETSSYVEFSKHKLVYKRFVDNCTTDGSIEFKDN